MTAHHVGTGKTDESKQMQPIHCNAVFWSECLVMVISVFHNQPDPSSSLNQIIRMNICCEEKRTKSLTLSPMQLTVTDRDRLDQ